MIIDQEEIVMKANQNQHLVLNIYKKLPCEKLSLPIDIHFVIRQIPNCKTISYQEFAMRHNISLEQVVKFMESKDASVLYYALTDQFLIIYNCPEERKYEKCTGRILFTLAHEVGHIYLKHHELLRDNPKLKNNKKLFKIMDLEADNFAGTLLCPFPVLKALNVRSAEQIRSLCGVSTQCSNYRAEQYYKWLCNCKPNDIDNEIIKLFENFIKRTTSRQRIYSFT